MSKMDKDALRVVFSDASRVGWSLRSDMKVWDSYFSGLIFDGVIYLGYIEFCGLELAGLTF